MSRRLFNPRSAYENERLIKREQKRFDYGMALDGEAREVGSGGSFPYASRKLINVRGYSDCIAGAPGTMRLTGADIGLTITNTAETLSDAIQTGQIYTANGNKIPKLNSVIELMSTDDLSGNPFATVKGSALKQYDNFRITSVSSGSEAITYIGNVRIPGMRGFGDRPETELTCSKSAFTVSRTAGPVFTPELIGAYFLWPDGKREKINGYLSDSQLTVARSGYVNETSGCIVQGMIHASYNFKYHNTIITLSHNRIYKSIGVPALGWEEINIIGPTLPSPSFCRFFEDGDDLLLVNSNGLYRINITQKIAYRLNVGAPYIRLYDNPSSATDVNGYRAVYTMSRIYGSTYNDQRIDAAKGAVLQHETAPVLINQGDGKDYGEYWAVNEIDEAHFIHWSNFVIPESTENHCTHFSLYRTKNINATGLSNGNKRNMLIWVKDCPIGKAFIVSRNASGVITASVGKFDIADVGNTVTFANGDVDIINSFISETQVQGSATSTELTSQAMGLGDGMVLTLSQTGKTITIESVFALTSANEGQQLFMANGSIVVIIRVIDATHAIVNMEYEYTSTAAVINPKSRVINDTIQDAILQTRIESGKSFYFLQNRFFIPFPNAGLGWMIPGFLVVAESDKNTYYYCNTGKRHLIGSYHPEKMTSDKIRDGIKSIRYFSGSLIIRCANCTYGLSTASTSEGGDVSIGEEFQILNDPEILDDAIGVPNDSSSKLLQNGNEVVWTSEPAVRIFDGSKYGENLAERFIMSEIRKYYPNVRMAYSPIDGLHIWGEQAQ